MLDVISYCIIFYIVLYFNNVKIYFLVKDQLNNLSDFLNALYDI